MNNPTSIVGYNRQYGGTKRATPAVLEAIISIDLDPTQASADTGKVLPAGAIPLGVQSLGGGTGGTNPTVNVGTLASSAGFVNELPADIVSATIISGVLIGVPLAVDTEIHAGVAASAATGGTTRVLVRYIMQDDGTA